MWGFVVASAAGAYIAQVQAQAAADGRPTTPREPDLAEAIREHRRKLERETKVTMRSAQIGTLLLLSLIVASIYGAAQLAGLA